MKNIYTLVSVILLLNLSSVSGQDKDTLLTDKLKFTGATVASGNGAVTSGLYLFSYFENKKANVYFTLSENDIEVSYLYKIIDNKINIGPNIGYFYNVPYLSVQCFTFSKYFNTLHWCGYSFGKPEMKSKYSQLFYFSLTRLVL